MGVKRVLGVLTLILLMQIVVASATFDEKNFFFEKSNNNPVTQVQGVVYKCQDTNCVNVGNKIFDQNSGGSNKLVIPFPSTNNIVYYGEYFYANCFIPKEFRVFSQGDGAITYNNFFNQAKNCRSPVSIKVVNSGFVNEPIVIGIDADISTTTQSAFRENQQPPFFTPNGFDDHYSAETKLKITVKDASNTVVFSKTKNLNLRMDSTDKRTFTFTPASTGQFTVEATTDVTDCQCSSKVNQASTKVIQVQPARPLNKCYTILNDLLPRDSFPVEGELVTFDVEKISNYMNNGGVNTPLGTEVDLKVTKSGTNILDTTIQFASNPDDKAKKVNFDVTFPNDGQFLVSLEGEALNCPATALDNIKDSISKTVFVDKQPTSSVTWSISEEGTGTVLPGAAITVNNGFNGVTDALGQLVLSGFVTGTYTYTIALNGFNTIQDSFVILTTDLDIARQMSTTNNAPFILPIPDQEQVKNKQIIFDLDLYGDDIDDPQSSLTWTANPSNGIITSVDALTHVLTITPTLNFLGQTLVDFVLTDPKGASASSSVNVFYFNCFVNGDCDDNDANTEDLCLNAGTVNSVCQNNPIACFVEGDCGVDGFLGQPFCDGNNDAADTFIDHTCNNGGTGNAACTATTTPMVIDDCTATETCENGACVSVACFVNGDCDDGNVNTQDDCISPGTGASFCLNTAIVCNQESDCGIDGFLGNTFCDGSGDVSDTLRDHTCNNAGTNTSSCSAVDTVLLFDDCTASEACENGACQTVACFVNGDCDDGNVNTEDVCVGPGTANATCVNTAITCFVNGDCGVDGLLGNTFCDGSGDVSDTFRSHLCNNAGTGTSFCNFNDNVQLATDCTASEACENGACHTVACFVNGDCDDGNVNTQDDCINPGAANATCLNTAIACSQESDCGVDGFLGSPFCDGNDDAADTFIDHTCVNPGTNASECQVGGVFQVIDDCTASETCENGACFNVACSQESDCGVDGLLGNTFCDGDGNVSDTFRDHTCNLAGQANSSCSFVDSTQLVTDCANNQVCENAACANVACNLETDCGIDGFLGNPFCDINGNVSDTFRDHTCLNAGTGSATCQIQDIPTLFQDCNNTQVCENDACTDVACFNDNDCDDNNPFTQDTCTNPGTGASFCGFQNILCLVNTDCGADNIIGKFTCSGNDIVQNFRSFVCLSAGTPTSSCVASDTPNFVQSCRFGCLNGQCLSKPQPGLKVEHISLRGAGSVRGSSLYFAQITVRNDGETNLRNLQMTATLTEFGAVAKSRHFDLSKRGTQSRKLFLELPTLEPGLYDARFVISNDKVRRVVHREILVE